MKEKFEKSETEKDLTNLPKSIKPFPDRDFARTAIAKSRLSKEKTSAVGVLSSRQRLLALLSIAACLLIAIAATIWGILFQKNMAYNGIGDYTTTSLNNFGFDDYNRQNGTDFPTLPKSDKNTRIFKILRDKNNRAVLFCESTIIDDVTVKLYVATKKSPFSQSLDDIFPDDCLTATINDVNVEFFGEKDQPSVSARFKRNRNTVFLIIDQTNCKKLFFDLLKKIL